MSQEIRIAKGERGIVRVFSVSLTDAEARGLKQDPEGLATELGAPGLLDMAHVEIFPLSDLEGVGLIGYLSEGSAIPEAELAPDRLKLELLEGWVLILYSQAFADHAAHLRPIPAFTLIGSYGAARTNFASGDSAIETASARPYSGNASSKPALSQAAVSGRIAMAVLVFLALFTWLFVWAAG